MSFSDVLALLVVFVAVPLTWLVSLVLLILIRKDPDNGVLRAQLVGSTAVALMVTVFAIVFLNNDMEFPPLDPEATRVLTRGSLLILSAGSALYLLRVWARR